MVERYNTEKVEKQIESMEAEIRRLKRKPTGAIGTLLLALGLMLLALAIIVEHNISAFIGIALTFWGALLLYVRPTNFVRKEILNSLSNQFLSEITGIIDRLGYQGQPFHISPPSLLGMRTTRLVIPKNSTDNSIDESSIDKLTVTPSMIAVDPPGQELSNLIEEELRTNFSASTIEYIENNMEKALVEGLEIVESFEMEQHKEEITVTFKGSIFYEVAESLTNSRMNPAFRDPLSSAFACILARVTQKKVIIEKIELIHDEKTIISTYRLQ